MKVLVVQLCPTLCDPMDCSPSGFSVHGNLQENTGVGSHFLLQGIFPTQRLNPHLLHCKQILYHLSHLGSFIHLRGDYKSFPLKTIDIFKNTETRLNGVASHPREMSTPQSCTHALPVCVLGSVCVCMCTDAQSLATVTVLHVVILQRVSLRQLPKRTCQVYFIPPKPVL